VEDEFIAQNCYNLNQAFYTSQGEKKAFVLSQGRNLMILKIVGYAEEAALYYQLLDFKAHIWIAHQRYPTRGRVWHPGGAHPFAALNLALVHNGDFANYLALTEYLSQRHFYPQFLTDTEVSAMLFDLWHRHYGYPLEYVIEAMAPTTERDFDLLPAKRQRLYEQIPATHVHGSPDGPWFFIIARNDTERQRWELIGISDTSMLRPQFFALQDGQVQIGLICSEKQAIDATLASLAREDQRFCPVADLYWNARGGRATDGGALDFLAESFMAGDPLKGGGFVIVNGLEFDSRGQIHMQYTPYPGANLFSLASGGAIYIRDPDSQVVPEQLNGGEIVPLSKADWNLILPYLQENERLFDISLEQHLLTVDGVLRAPHQVYRKIQPLRLAVPSGTAESWD